MTKLSEKDMGECPTAQSKNFFAIFWNGIGRIGILDKRTSKYFSISIEEWTEMKDLIEACIQDAYLRID